MVLGPAVRERGLDDEAFAAVLSEERAHADLDFAGDCRHDRSAGREHGAVPGSEVLWRAGGIGGVSAREPRVSRGETSGGPAEQDRGVVPKILGLEQIEPLLEPDGLRAVMAEVLMELSAGRAAAPARIAAHSAEGLLAAMPGQAAGVLGAKLVTVFPGNAAKGLPGHQALVALFDAGDGLPLALLEGTAITTARTAAVSAVAADALARRDAGVL